MTGWEAFTLYVLVLVVLFCYSIFKIEQRSNNELRELEREMRESGINHERKMREQQIEHLEKLLTSRFEWRIKRLEDQLHK